MERLKYILFLSLFLQISFSQQVFETSIFPENGDSIVYYKDILSKPNDFSEGGDKRWDFRNLDSPIYTKQFLERSNFTNYDGSANLYFKSPGNKALVKRTEKGIEELGFTLTLGNNGSRLIPVFYNEAFFFNKDVLEYQGSAIQKRTFSIVIKKTDLPINIQRDIPKSIKKIKIAGVKTISLVTDAWGTLFMPGETFQANRVQISELTRIKIIDEETRKQIPYFDSKMISQIIPIQFSKRYYEFYSNNYTDAAARIYLNDEGDFSQIEYQSGNQMDSGNLISISKHKEFLLFPNPTYNIAKVFISNRESGNYKLAVYNIIGKKLWQMNIYVDGETIIKENFGFLPKGTYLFSLLDENDNILKTVRLIIISV